MSKVSCLFVLFSLLLVSVHGQILHGNRNPFATYDAKGEYILIGGEDVILLTADNKELDVINKKNPEGKYVAFSPDGTLAAAETLDNQIFIYHLKDKNNAPLYFKSLPRQAGQQVRIKISPDNKMLATSNSEKVLIYDITKGSEGNILLRIGIDPRNAQRGKSAFDITDDWSTIFFNMQSITLTNNAGKLSYQYGRMINWTGVNVDLSVLSSDGKSVVVAGLNGTEQRLYNLVTGDLLQRNFNLKTSALAANKDFSKIYMNQAVWNIKDQKLLTVNQRELVDKNDKTQISVAPNGDFIIGLYQFSADGRLKQNLQVNLPTFNRVEFSGDNELHLFKDNANGTKYDLHTVIISDALRGRSNRNLTNTKKLNTALATSADGSFGINQLGRIIRRDNMTVSSPIFKVTNNGGLAADISPKNLVAFLTGQSLLLYSFDGGIKNMELGKSLPSITLKKIINANEKAAVKLSADNSMVAITSTVGNINTIQIYEIKGNLVKTIQFASLSDFKFSNDSTKFYYSSGKKLVCLQKNNEETSKAWEESDSLTFYAETGNIISFAFNSNDSLIAYTTTNGSTKIVKPRYGISTLTCNMTLDNILNVSKN